MIPSSTTLAAPLKSRGGIGNDTFVHNNDGVTFITDVGGNSDSSIFNVADVGTLQFFQVGNDLIIADALDTNFENFVDVVGFSRRSFDDAFERLMAIFQTRVMPSIRH